MNLQKAKGQSAVEYLTTYGWMLLVVAIVGGAIFTTVQNSAQIQSTSGLANADVQIEKFGVTESGFEAELRGASSDQVEDVNFSLTDPESGETVYSSAEVTIPVGDTETVALDNVSSSENTNTYDVELEYDTGGLEGLTTEGTLTGRLELDSSSSGSEGSGPTGAAAVSASGAPSFSTAPSGEEYESSWVPVAPDSGVSNGFSYFFDETSDEEYFNVSEGFYVMKYEAKPYNTSSNSFDVSSGTTGSDDWASEDYVPRSVAANKPWRDISFNEGDPANGYGAVQACEALDSQTDEFDVHLVTNREWMTVARQVEQNGANWNTSSPSVDGQLIRGNSEGSEPYNASTDDSNGFYRLASGEDNDYNERTFELANGQTVWDWAGNVRHWVYSEDSGGSTTNGVFDSTVATNGSDDPVALEYEYDPAVVDRTTNGVGSEYDFGSGDAALRGGYWGDFDGAGVFRAFSSVPDGSYLNHGFRCSAVPVS